mgnify:CR=1 FL=1
MDLTVNGKPVSAEVDIRTSLLDLLREHLDLPGTKWVIGGGPQMRELQRRYRNARFFGPVETEELARRYAQSDCFVFPSRTDTFGLVMVEALASGVPVAAYPVPGPIDIVTDNRVGALHENLGTACLNALNSDPVQCRRHAESFAWEECARQFRDTLRPIPRSAWLPLKGRAVPNPAS